MILQTFSCSTIHELVGFLFYVSSPKVAKIIKQIFLKRIILKESLLFVINQLKWLSEISNKKTRDIYGKLWSYWFNKIIKW